jgi:hypothetical protein
MKVIKGYKIFDLGVDEHNTYPKTLFHGVQGSRQLPLGEWIKAEKKMVTDGSRSSHYLSGFHVYKTVEDVKEWFKRAKHLQNRVVVEVSARQCRQKPCAIRPTILSDWLFISEEAWSNRILALQFAG